MSMGRFDSVTFEVSRKTGNPWAKVIIDGERYIAFDGKVLNQLKSIKSGSTVELATKSTQNGDLSISSISEVSGEAPAVAGTIGAKTAGGNAQRESGDARQLSILYGYAKDAVLAGAVGDYIKTPASFADRVSTTAYELSKKYKQSLLDAEDSVATTERPT